MKDRGTSIKVSKEYKDFVENVVSTRRSKIMGIDNKRLTQMEVGELIVKYFKSNDNVFLSLIKFKMEKNVQ